jgi:hypothetical protein
MALREQRIWGVKERLFERVLPRLTPVAIDNLLHSAHLVDGIVKGLKAPDWPTDGWQALHRLALSGITANLCPSCPMCSGFCMVRGASVTRVTKTIPAVHPCMFFAARTLQRCG